MVRISVIMPVYNVQEYLNDALDSLLNQTMINDIEVLMIDDGSTDNSRYIIDEYAEKYENFFAYHKKNEGPAIARNYGLDLARGEYIHFMDADDYIPPKAYENLYYFNPYNDFIVGNVLKFGEYNIWENILFRNAFNDFNSDVKTFKMNEFPNVLWDTITCNKLYKKEFLDKNNIRFINKNIYYEDLLFSLQTYVFADSIGFSRNIFYFWRFRKDKSSITQKQDDIRNFKNRLEVLKIYDSLMNKYGFDDSLKEVVYSKWLKHDLKTSLKKIRNYPGKYYEEILNETNELLNIIPAKLRENLNFYLKILYKIVENKDINSLLVFAHIEDDLKSNPFMKLNIDEDYLSYIDIDCEINEKYFEAYITDVFNDDEKLYIEFSHNLNYNVNNCPHELEILLISDDYNIKLKIKKNQIIIPLNLIKDKDHLKIKVLYNSREFKKETLLKNYSRKSIRYANYDIDLGIGINNILYLDVRRKNNNEIIIEDIYFDGTYFIFKCNSAKKVKNLVLTNYVSYRQFSYAAKYSKHPYKFIFIVPYDDLTNNVINKWELNCPDAYNLIHLANNEFRFSYNNHKILLKNKRNKIFISNKIIKEYDNVEDIILKNEELIKQNNILSNKNVKLNKNLEEFKSRKLIRLVDNFRSIFK